MSDLSIIIPAGGDVSSLENTLGSVLRHRPPHCEVLVVHDGSYEDPYDVCDEVLFVESPGADAVDLLNVGLEISECPIVHFLGVGVEPTAGWTDSIWRHFEDDNVAAVCPVITQQDRIACAGISPSRSGGRRLCGKGRKLSAGTNQLAPVGPSLQAGFYRRECLEWLQGFSYDVGAALTDLDLALSLKRLDYQCVLEPASVLTAAEPGAAVRGSFSAGKERQRFFKRHQPELGGSLLSLSLHVAGEFTRELFAGGAVPGLLGRLFATLERNVRTDYEALLDEAQAAATSAHVHAFPAATRRTQQQRRAA